MSEERWKDIPDCPGFQVSWDGNFRSLDRVSPSGRRLKGQPLPTRPSNKGYLLVDLRDADGKRVTRSAHSVVLATFAGTCEPGMQSRHLDDNPQHNRWRPGREEESRKAGGNLFYGDGADQHRDKVRNNGGPLPTPTPAYDCLNHTQCGGKVRNPGRRCVPCVEQVGRDAASMLGRGENLMKVAQRFGYTGTDWVFSLAVKHGGYRGTRAEAQAQGRKWSQRVTATVRNRLRRGDARSPDAAKSGDRTSAKAGTAPFGRVSQKETVGHSGHSRTSTVAERDIPKVTQRERPSRATGSVTRRSR